MKDIEPLVIYFKDDGVTPNNSLPVLVYRHFFQGSKENYAALLEEKFQENNWTGNWRNIVLDKDHYHSTTHEVLGISKGGVDLWLGGENGGRFEAVSGDVLVLPAGVAHRSMGNDNFYEVIGGYPEGLPWDMIYCEPHKYNQAKKTIELLHLPKTDPLYGLNGPLTRIWK